MRRELNCILRGTHLWDASISVHVRMQAEGFGVRRREHILPAAAAAYSGWIPKSPEQSHTACASQACYRGPAQQYG